MLPAVDPATKVFFARSPRTIAKRRIKNGLIANRPISPVVKASALALDYISQRLNRIGPSNVYRRLPTNIMLAAATRYIQYSPWKTTRLVMIFPPRLYFSENMPRVSQREPEITAAARVKAPETGA
jgi:hypothetical protein